MANSEIQQIDNPSAFSYSYPKISIALAGRNDDYGGGYLDKVKLSIHSLQRSLSEVDYEIVLVDYNPPSNKPLLSEIFPNSIYPKIKHIVFPYEEHIEYLQSHWDAGGRLYFNNKELSKQDIFSIDFLRTFAFGVLAIKYCTGEYILSTGTDNIFPVQFGDFIDKLEPDILYRSIQYRLFIRGKDVKLNSFLNSRKNLFVPFSEAFVKNMKRIGIKKYYDGFLSVRNKAYPVKLQNYISSSAGNFILMDKNSWRDIGGYLHTLNPRPFLSDHQILFFALAYKKKIKCVDFPIYHLPSEIIDQHLTDFEEECFEDKQFINKFSKKDIEGQMNYIIDEKDSFYDYRGEFEETIFSQKKSDKEIEKYMRYWKEWKKFEKFICLTKMKPNKSYFIGVSYKERLEELKKYFSSIFPEKFLL